MDIRIRWVIIFARMLLFISTFHPAGVQNIAVNVCLSVYSHISKIECLKFHQIYLWPWLNTFVTAVHITLCTCSFLDDVFSHNRANRPESKVTCMFRPVRQVAAPEVKYAVSDCIWFVAGVA